MATASASQRPRTRLSDPYAARPSRPSSKYQVTTSARSRQALKFVSHGVSIITVQIGEEEASKTFTVHENLLVKHSDFFRTALNGRWAESKSHSLPLPEHDPDSFSVFTQFLYTGQVYTATDDEDDLTVEDGKVVRDKEWSRLNRAWKLGNCLLASSYKDAIADAVIAKMHGCNR